MRKGAIFYNRTGFFTLLNREVHRFMKVYIQTILAPLLSNILFLGIFGGILQSRDIGLEGVGYLQFLVPGLVTMGAIFASFQNPSFSIVAQKFQNTIQDLNSYPISDTEKTLAYVLGGAFRGVLVGVLTYVATIFFVGYTIEYPILFFVAIFAISCIFASIGLITGLYLNNFEKMNFVLAIVITPLTFLGGVFFEISKLEGVLSLSRFLNPIYPLVNLSRYMYLGASEGNILIHTGIAGVLLVGAFAFAWYTLKNGVGIKVD
ncbi:ABC transporter permease [Desulfuribacillus alkaliarsenatis]|uniref:Transport permease protein n=1 Tax=Desulfuribacillus alkaliarsenatis TaxID=766136 RepID=A0A1E5G2V2_9FIRM|nr:ABC transporter permease [Desulfuribacillus alkaliarsenatis]OEF97388.1 ABC transporter [Desulfuribacillus alkaliarsenatis]